jgi:hypothetical protein
MNADKPNRIVVNTDALPERDRFPAFCEEYVRRYTGLDFVKRDKSTFRGKIELQRAGEVDVGYISDCRMSANGMVRPCSCPASDRRRADIHDGPEHDTLQSEAGYIDARPLPSDRQNLLRRTAGPYIRVKKVDPIGGLNIALTVTS